MSASTQVRVAGALPRITPCPQREDDPRPSGPTGWGRWLLLAAGAGLLGYLLFCHGCHGDEDNELFAVAALKG
jgi:hypothetical protein